MKECDKCGVNTHHSGLFDGLCGRCYGYNEGEYPIEECEECGDMGYLSNGICHECAEAHSISYVMDWYLEEYENAIHEEQLQDHNYKINTTMAFFVHIRQWFPIEIREKIWSMYLNTQ